MGTDIAKLTDIGDEKLGALLARSNYFQDAKDAGQAIVKVLAGREIGLGPIASMTGIYVINGRVAFGANVMAAALKRTGRYTYRIVEHSDKVCRIEFREHDGKGWVVVGESAFTIEDAKKAGTKNLDKFPRNMLFARAMSNGVRWYAPDVFAGAPVYTPEELGADVNEDGDVIEAKPVAVRAEVALDTLQEQGASAAVDLKTQVEAALHDKGLKLADARKAIAPEQISAWLAHEGNTIDKLVSLAADAAASN